MEQAAAPGEVYITAATHSLAAHCIEAQPLTPLSVKGISEPVSVFALRRIRPAEETTADVNRTPFVGRYSELVQFRVIQEACIENGYGYGHTVYVRGEPGIGKTRLVDEFMRIATENGVSTHRSLVLPFGVGKGQDAIHSLVRSLLGIRLGSGKAERQRIADAALTDGRLHSTQAVFLLDLLDLRQPKKQRTLYDAMDNTTRIEGKHSVASRLLSTACNNQPVLIVIEDVHWADAITLAHLSDLTRTIAEFPALLVMTSRIDSDRIDRQWLRDTAGCPFVTIELGPLRQQESMALIGGFSGLSNALAENYLERAAGNPLFLEELLRNAKDGYTEGLPDSVQSLVLARLDRLAPEDKQALQVASVMGQQVEMKLLRHLLDNDGYDCRALVEHNLMQPNGATHLFAHALIREGVYNSLLKRQRQHLHQKAAAWFSGDDLLLHAQHLEQADDGRAPTAYLAAAQEQTLKHRPEHALNLIESGLVLAHRYSDRHRLNCLKGELLHDLGNINASMLVYQETLENAEDDEQRCDAWIGLAAKARVSTDHQYAFEMLDRAEPLATKHKLTPLLTRLHHLRGNLFFQLGNNGCHREHQTALDLARQAGLMEDQVRALGGLGDAAYAKGLMITAHDNFSQCIKLCNEHGFGRIEAAYMGMAAFARMAFDPLDDVLSCALEAVNSARRVGHQRAEMNARLGVCWILILTGKYDLVEPHAERAQELVHTLGAHTWEGAVLLCRGLARYQTSQDGTIELVAQAASMSRNTGWRSMGDGLSVGWHGSPTLEHCGKVPWTKVRRCCVKAPSATTTPGFIVLQWRP